MGKRKTEYLDFYEDTNVFQVNSKQSQFGQNGMEGILKVFDNFNIHIIDQCAEQCSLTYGSVTGLEQLLKLCFIFSSA